MAGPRSKEQLNFPLSARDFLWPVLLLAFATIGGCFLVPVYPFQSTGEPTEVIKRHLFGFMQKTSQWMEPTPVLMAGERSFNLTDKLGALQTHSLYLYPESDSFHASPRKTFAHSVLGSLGAANPWQATTLGEPILGFTLDPDQAYKLIAETLSPQIDLPATDAVWNVENGRVTAFLPNSKGKSLDIKKTVNELIRAMFENRSTLELPVVNIEPRVTLTELNQYGIKELVARGESDFSGSTPSRIQNIVVGAKKFDGLLISPGEEFSFVQALGPVNEKAGFKPELVIKTGGTVPELGGGLCQVSTTAFRAALNAGLPITARRNHSYAVKYYAPQGTDATIYPGAVDLKFVNDSPAYLLIKTRVEKPKLIFEFYGTNDGRTVRLDGPYQYDKKTDGSMKARLTRVITRGDVSSTEDFYSKYVSKDLFPVIYEYPTVSPTPSPTPTPLPSPTATPITETPTPTPSGAAQN